MDKANELLERIRTKRDDAKDRPLVLLGHSLGGLLIEQALVNAHNNQKYTHIRDATYVKQTRPPSSANFSELVLPSSERPIMAGTSSSWIWEALLPRLREA